MFSSKPAAPEKKKVPECKICCACPAARRQRDECVIFNSFEECREQIQGFYDCLLTEGFTQGDVDSLKKSTKQWN
jgi:cytochrome c oxidase assembly protein subunit 17